MSKTSNGVLRVGDLLEHSDGNGNITQFILVTSAPESFEIEPTWYHVRVFGSVRGPKTIAFCCQPEHSCNPFGNAPKKRWRVTGN